jgi:squalene-associated FAD-dependent desaturase
VQDPGVIVVGGGFAGLSAAAALADAGVPVTVLEARPRLGGRATAFVDRQTGELVDNGQHVLFGCYDETFKFLRRIGADGNVRMQPSLSATYMDLLGRRSVLRCPPLPSPLHLVAAVLDWDAMPWPDRLSVLRLVTPLRAARRELARTGAVTAGSDLTVSAWLDRYRQGRKLRKWLWEPLAVAALNQPPDQASAAAFVRVLAQMFGPDPSAASVVLPTRPLHQMYAEPARAFIESRAGVVRTGSAARVVVEDGRVAGVDERDARLEARAVIAAVPWYSLRTVFTSVPPALTSIVDSADAMASMPILTVNLWYDRRVMDEPFVGLPGRKMQWVFDKRLAFGEEASHLSLISSGATELVGMTNDELSALAGLEVAGGIPGARDAQVLRATVIRERRATFSLAPGQPRRPGTRTPVAGLFLAGDWIDTGLPGTIESAVVSGHRAAAEVLAESRRA